MVEKRRWKRKGGKEEETHLTEVRGLDGLATLRFTSSGDLYIEASKGGGEHRGRQTRRSIAREGNCQLDPSSRNGQLT